MFRTENENGFKLAAIDLDGTLLGPDHQVSAANARAVRQLQARGAQVVLASGRHYNSMRKYADALPGVQWLVSCQGGEVSDVRRQKILSRAFLPGAQAKAALELGQSLGFTPVAYSVDGVYTDAHWNEELEFYAELAGHRPVGVSTPELLKQEVIKVIWMGEPELISGVGLPLSQLPPSVQAVRTHERILEFMPANVSKGSALATLAGSLGIDGSEAVVFGDGENDIPMFDWAGVSVAMPHGWAAAIRHATWVAPNGPVETALARGVEMVLANRASGSSERPGQRAATQHPATTCAG
jgi:Cof subfamily protein (haloacid dehalogenase superfamily)